jgi:arsenate reductase
MADVTIYHNPRCTKSRQTLQLLEEKGITPEVVLYLETPPSKETVKELLSKLGKKPLEIVRKNEAEFCALGLNAADTSDDQIINGIVSAPKLLERPIVVKGDKAAIGRPPENVLAIL